MRRGGTQGQPGRNCHACFVARAGAAILCSLPVSRCGTRRTERLKTNEQENGGCSCCRWSAPRTARIAKARLQSPVPRSEERRVGKEGRCRWRACGGSET